MERSYPDMHGPARQTGQLPAGFVGRRRELDEVCALLADPACRLLTLLGPGGIGKSHLALAAVAQLREQFGGAVAVVSLEALSSADLLAPAIAESLEVPLAGGDPYAQIGRSLAGREMLLVLDAFETFLASAADLARLLAATDGLKLLATSREALGLQEEWLYWVDGLAAPVDAAHSGWSDHDAVQLFVARARQVRSDFSAAAEAAAVVAICRLVEGMPLAIELAAAYLRSLTCAEVAAEIARSLDTLTATQRHVPERRRSLRAVFDHAWRRLEPAERDVLKRLAVFPETFRRGDAVAVAAASLPTLTALVDRSLLRWEPESRRYRLHALVRQYAAEQLDAESGALAAAREAHCAHFAAELHAWFDAIFGPRQQEAVAGIEAELANIRAAWSWATQTASTTLLRRMAPVLAEFYQIRSRYLEGADAFERATQSLRRGLEPGSGDPTLALLLTFQGAMCIRLGRLTSAAEVLAEAQGRYQQLGVPPLPGQSTDPAFALGLLALVRSDYAEARRLGEQALQTGEAHQNQLNLELAAYLLARAAQGRGEAAEAGRWAQLAYELTHTTGDHWFRAYCHNLLGDLAMGRGEHATARRHYEASYRIREAFNDPEGMAIALASLGESALAEGSATEARRLFEQSWRYYQQLGDRGGLATAIHGLGEAALALGELEPARLRLHEALRWALEAQYVPRLLAILVSIGRLCLAAGVAEEGVTLLALVSGQPAVSPALQARIKALFGHARPDLAPAFLTASSAAKPPPDPLTIAAEILRRSDAAAPTTLSALPIQANSGVDETLAEPLSEREREVLRLVAAGLKNREIGERLFISLNTVKAHINAVYGKLGVGSRVQAVERARALGLL